MTGPTPPPEEAERPFRRVLVAVELSPAAESFVRDLRWLRTLGTTDLVLVHVRQAGELDPEVCHARLRALGSYLRGDGFEVQQKMGTGHPSKEVARIAADTGASVIVVGSKSRREGHTGDVALDVIRRSEVPVLLVRTRDAPPDAPAMDPLALDAPSHPVPERVLFATDFSVAAARALSWTEKLVSLGIRRIDLLHGRPPGGTKKVEAERELGRLAERLALAGAEEVNPRVSPVEAARAIMVAAADDPLPLVVMGTHGRGFLSRALMGSVAREVARKVEAPLLLVPD
ncbi:MAG: universal stress protein [Gemmatimonadales bacterium]|nr:MAG: universal stress protein [Gemmatimonadales bacterium]